MNALNSVLTGMLLLAGVSGTAQTAIYVNHVAYDSDGPKKAVISTDQTFKGALQFKVINVTTSETDFSAELKPAGDITEWTPGKHYYTADFTGFRTRGKFRINITVSGKRYSSEEFKIGKNALSDATLGAIVHYYHKQRANTPQELAGDKTMLLYGSDKTVDIRGGWADASGDISKYFSHLAYANFMSPQQIPMVAWSMANTYEKIPKTLTRLGIKDSLLSEALWGTDYIMRSLSKEGYFYMTVFSYFKPDITARRIVGLEADSKTTADYQCAFREGGGWVSRRLHVFLCGKRTGRLLLPNTSLQRKELMLT